MRNTGGGGGEIEIISFQLYSISVDFTVLKGTFGGSKVNAVLPTHHGPAFGIPSHYPLESVGQQIAYFQLVLL